MFYYTGSHHPDSIYVKQQSNFNLNSKVVVSFSKFSKGTVANAL